MANNASRSAPDFTQALTTFVPEVVRQRVYAISLEGKDIECPLREPFETVALFADVSGFTKLSEALAVRGPGGAEDLCFYLNRYLERLSKVIARSGGDVFKFAGDAMLVLWPPEAKDKENPQALANKVHRAAQCSLDIQAELKDADLAENVRLSVKLGIGVGEALVLYVGGVYKRVEYLSCGKPFNEAFHCEHLAEPGDTILSMDAWRLVGGHFRGEQRADAMRLVDIINPIRNKSIRSQVYNSPQMGELLRRFIPAAVIPHLKVNEEFWAGELRQISCVFVNLGFNATDITSSPDSLKLVQKVISTVQRSVYDFEGSLNKFLIDDKGSTLIAVWGLPPLAHEDDPKRAVLACLKMRRLMADMNLACSCGITSGLALCGLVGAGSRREYTVLGDVVNLSARLMQAALAETKGSALPIAKVGMETPNAAFIAPSLLRRDSKQLGGLSGSLLLSPAPSLAQGNEEKEAVILSSPIHHHLSRGHLHSNSSSALPSAHSGSTSSRASTMASSASAASMLLQSPRAGGVAGTRTGSTPSSNADTSDPKWSILSKGMIIDQATYDAATGTSLLTFDTLEPIMVKGKSNPIAIYRPFRELKPKIKAYTPTKFKWIVSRDAEMSRLTAIIDSMLLAKPGQTPPTTHASSSSSSSVADDTGRAPRASISISNTAMKKRATVIASGRNASASVAAGSAAAFPSSAVSPTSGHLPELPSKHGAVGPGGGSLVVIQGEVGVGKTHLLTSINVECDDEVRFIWSVGEQAHSSIPFAYWHRMFVSIMECSAMRAERKVPHADDPRIVSEQKLIEDQLHLLILEDQPLLAPVLPLFNLVGRTNFNDTRESTSLLFGKEKERDRSQTCSSDPYPDTIAAAQLEPIIAVATQVFAVLLRHLCGVINGGDPSATKPCVLVLDEAQFMHTSDWQLTVAIGKALILPPADPLHTSNSSNNLSTMSPSAHQKNDSGLLVGSPLVGTATVGWSPLTNAHTGGMHASSPGSHYHHHPAASSVSQYGTLKINSGHLSLKGDLSASALAERHARVSPLAHLNLPPSLLMCRLSIFIGTRPLYNKKYRPLFENHAPPEYSELVNIKHGVAEVITLGNCDIGSTAAVLKRHFNDQPRYLGNVLSVDKHLVDEVHQRTGGRFGFIIRFAKTFDNIGALELTKDKHLCFRRAWVLTQDFETELPIPYKIQRTTASHLDRLAPSQIFLLKLGSVISVGMGLLNGSFCFDLGLLTNIHNIPAYKASLAGDLLSLQDMGFLFEHKVPDDVHGAKDDHHHHHHPSAIGTPPREELKRYPSNESSPPPTPTSPTSQTSSLTRTNTSKKLGIHASQISLTLHDANAPPRYFAFTYGFIRDIIYQLMLYKQRQRLHRAVADFIQGKTRNTDQPLDDADKDVVQRHNMFATNAQRHKTTDDRLSRRASGDHGQPRGFFSRLFSCCGSDDADHDGMTHEKRTSRVLLSHREQSSVTSNKKKLSMILSAQGKDKSLTGGAPIVEEKKLEDRSSRNSGTPVVVVDSDTGDHGKRSSNKGPSKKDRLLTSDTELSDMRSVNLAPLTTSSGSSHDSNDSKLPLGTPSTAASSLSTSSANPSGLSLALAQHRGTLVPSSAVGSIGSSSSSTAGSPRSGGGSASPRGGLHGVAYVIDTVKLLEGAEESARRTGMLPSPTTLAKHATFSQRTSDLLGASPILDASLLQSEGPESPDGSDLAPFETVDYTSIAAICRTTKGATPLPATLSPTSDRARALLMTSSQWSFDIFEFTEMAGGGASPLLYMGYHLFHVYDLPRRMNIADKVLIDFLRDIEYGYNVNENTYHNSIHAADVSQSVHAILSSLHQSAERIDPLDLMAIITAAIIHDYRHPGVTNQFLTASSTPAADADEKEIERILLLKSDPGHLLENFHCLAAFRCMHREKNNILKNLLPDNQRLARIKILRLVMATSLADHFDFIKRLDRDVVTRYKADLVNPDLASSLASLSTHAIMTRYLATATSTPSVPLPSAEDQATLMLLQLLLKCADISNAAKKEKVYQEWLTRILNEFYRQGDHEREQGLPCSPYMDRFHPDEAKSQAMFITRLVQPLYELLTALAPTLAPQLLANLNANRSLAEDKLKFDRLRRSTMSRASVILPLGRGSIILQPSTLHHNIGAADSLLSE